MENASKALIIAGGILIALLVASGLIVMWTQISNYSNEEADRKKEEQLIRFNQEYATYDRDNVLGSDILTLSNKAKDYNTLKPVDNYVEYKEIKISIKLAEKNKFGGKLFKDSEYAADNLYNLLKPIRMIESTNGLAVMQKLSSNYNKIEILIKSGMPFKEAIREVIGRYINNIQLSDIEQYREYSEFKSSKFQCTDRNYNNGQIVSLTFTINKQN